MRRRNLDRQRRRLVARISCDGDGLRGFVRQGRRGSFSSLETFFVGCRGVDLFLFARWASSCQVVNRCRCFSVKGQPFVEVFVVVPARQAPVVVGKVDDQFFFSCRTFSVIAQMIVVGVFLVARLGRVKVRQFVGTFLKWNGSCRSSAECHRLQRGHVHRCCSNTLNGNDSLDTLRTFGLSIVVDLICRTIVLTSEVEIVVAIVLVAAGRVRRGVGRNLDIVVDKFPERFESPNF